MEQTKRKTYLLDWDRASTADSVNLSLVLIPSVIALSLLIGIKKNTLKLRKRRTNFIYAKVRPTKRFDLGRVFRDCVGVLLGVRDSLVSPLESCTGRGQKSID